MRPEGAARGGSALLTATLVVLTSGAGLLSGGLAAARILSPVSRHGIELVAFTPFGLPAALLAVVTSCALLLLLRRRAAGMVVLAVAVALTAVHAWWLAPQFTGTVPSADPAAARLVVMTQNFEEGDPAKVVSIAREHAVDVLVLTDTTEAKVAAVAAGLAETLRFNTLGDGRGSVVWSRFPITAADTISDGGDSRVVTVEVPGLEKVSIVAVHPTPPYQADGSRWQDDWERIMDRIRGTYGEDVAGRVLVAGDFNATASHWPVRALTAMGLRDSGEQLNSGLATTWPANGRQARLGVTVPTVLALDHIMTARGLVPTEQLITGEVGSDHRGVIATLTLPLRGGQ